MTPSYSDVPQSTFKHIDIIIQVNGMLAKIKSNSPEGFMWIREHMDHREDFTVSVQSEFLEELIGEMEKAGLNVQKG
jgi:hypothetical protein